MKVLGGDGQANGFMTPTPGRSGARAQRAVRRVSDMTALEQRMEKLTQTVEQLVNQNEPVIRRRDLPVRLSRNIEGICKVRKVKK